MKFFPPKRNFSSLSVRDLLDAREAYHVHLAHLDNVIGTAIGRRLIRRGEAHRWDEDERDDPNREPRTLSNSVVRPWSRPCVLVFVKEWVKKRDLDASELVPKYLYLSDGRLVPTCVVYTPPDERPAEDVTTMNFPTSMIGGGYSVITDAQGSESVGSVGCLVTNGDLTFALTNRHVTGDAGQTVYSIMGGERVPIGKSDAVQARHIPFSEVYPGFPGNRVFTTIDAGLIRVDDVADWTAQIYGVGELADVANLNVDTVSLDLIGCPLKAFGSVSGVMEGKIKALFYRYRSVGGFDYVADVLIGPRDDAKMLPTQPGDSGTMWVFDPPKTKGDWEDAQFHDPHHKQDRGKLAPQFRPLALQWGGTRVMGAQKDTAQFALATFVSSICRVLNVDVIKSWNTGHPEYWGKIAHFKIGAKACEMLPAGKLRDLMMANVENIGVKDDRLKEGKSFTVDRKAFVPMADVPDYVFGSVGSMAKQNAKNGRPPAPGTLQAARLHEGDQHFADMDIPSPAFGKTLLDLVKSQSNISADVWKKFYDAFPGDTTKPGSLPFRVWQIYRAMVAAIKKGETDEFVASAGVLAHYIGDACQPLHISQWHHGGVTEKDDPKKYAIHSIYEEGMFERRPAELLTNINNAAKGHTATPIVGNGRVKTRDGFEAALATVELMKHTFAALDPKKIVAEDAKHLDQNKPQRAEQLFNAFGKSTANVIADGILLLARLWLTAWEEADGDDNVHQRTKCKPENLTELYKTPAFLPALSFDEMIAQGYLAPGTSAPDRSHPKPKPKPRPRRPQARA